MIIVGSYALNEVVGKTIREPKDLDYLCTELEWEEMKTSFKFNSKTIERKGNKGHIHKLNGQHLEFDIAQEGDSTSKLIEYCESKKPSMKEESVVAPLEVLLLLKQSHKYLKDSPHFLKTMHDIHFLEKHGVVIPEELLPVLKQREDETYWYKHPKLDVTKNDFFKDDVPYIYDHDTIHIAVAVTEKPAYMSYMKDDSEVMTSKEKFFSQDVVIQLLGVYEEACVLALERSQIPNNFDIDAEKSFRIALMKVCTSITSGYFRKFAYDNYWTVMAIYNKMGKNDYVERFKKNSHMLKPYEDK